MTEQERLQRRKEYRREWNRSHPEKVREYKRTSAIRRTINAINAGEVVLVKQTVLAERHED